VGDALHVARDLGRVLRILVALVWVHARMIETLEEAKQFLRENWGIKPVDCPCCKQRVHRYRRKLNSGMARSLIAILRADQDGHAEEGWIHINHVLAKYGVSATDREAGKLAGWGLIESRGDRGTASKTSGYWRLTDNGRAFARREIRVQKYVYMFNGSYYGNDGDLIDIVDALGDHFNYYELMAGI
jgi:hypothetical protein